ncbi:hypothetical protein SDC9_184069 [bioreactor metagenome]|uniref:Uncharacterized protein n=1 Tax=bioreactor metagenome TaxID=1076179 RepID=A0A645HCW1_9ZZZZ
MCLPESAAFLIPDPALKGDEFGAAILVKHPEFAVNTALSLEHGKPETERLSVVGRKKIPEPFADHLIARIAKQITPLLIHFNKTAIDVQGLIAQRRLVKQQPEPLF